MAYRGHKEGGENCGEGSHCPLKGRHCRRQVLGRDSPPNQPPRGLSSRMVPGGAPPACGPQRVPWVHAESPPHPGQGPRLGLKLPGLGPAPQSWASGLSWTGPI